MPLSYTTGIRCACSNACHATTSGGAPKALTTNTAAGGSGSCRNARSAISGVRTKLYGSTSARYGVNPTLHTACALATKVKDGIRQNRRPGKTLQRSASSIAVVPLAVNATCTVSAPVWRARRAANFSRNSCQSGPQLLYQWGRVDAPQIRDQQIGLRQAGRQDRNMRGSHGRRMIGCHSVSLGICSCHPDGRALIQLAGTPATIALAGTARMTVAPAPTMDQAPNESRKIE
jgi:hypothetical protein